MDQSKVQKIIVAGDVTLDWLQASQGARQMDQNWRLAEGARLYQQRGGAAQLGDLIGTLIPIMGPDPGWELIQTASLSETYQPGDPAVHQVYTLWAPFHYGTRPHLNKEEPAWRIERFLGLDRSKASPGMRGKPQTDRAPDRADLIVLDDSNLGFRDNPDVWPRALEDHTGWVLIKSAQPVAQGPLWENLISQHE